MKIKLVQSLLIAMPIFIISCTNIESDSNVDKYTQDLPSQVGLKLPKLKKVNKTELPKIKLPKLKKVTEEGVI